MDMTLFQPKNSIGATISNSLNTRNESFNIISKFPTIKSAQTLWNNNDENKHCRLTFLPLWSLKLKRKEWAVKNIGGGGWRIQGIDDGSCGIAPYMAPSPIDVVEDFHKYVNERNLDKLDQLLTNNCHYEDLLFYVPFLGKEGVKRFFDSVIDAMGPNGSIVIDKVTEGQGLTASVFCHLGTYLSSQIYSTPLIPNPPPPPPPTASASASDFGDNPTAPSQHRLSERIKKVDTQFLL
ncbi:hypothetical protein CsatA_029110 [Cannabis sativa]